MDKRFEIPEWGTFVGARRQKLQFAEMASNAVAIEQNAAGEFLEKKDKKSMDAWVMQRSVALRAVSRYTQAQMTEDEAFLKWHFRANSVGTW